MIWLPGNATRRAMVALNREFQYAGAGDALSAS